MLQRAAYHAVDHVARHAYGSLLGKLSAFTRDIAAAEDALAEALASALSSWTDDHLPDNPEAWLLTTAKRKIIDTARRSLTAQSASADLITQAMERAEQAERTGWPLADPRLKLMFVCAHPAITTQIHAPLMMQTVLGMPVAQIAPIFLERTKALEQQLVRCKKKIKLSGVPFEIPEQDSLPERAGAVLDAIYATFTAAQNMRSASLMDEAIYLASLCVRAMPQIAEAKGLAALCLYQRARFGADRDGQGNYVPLSSQSASDWNAPMISDAERLLTDAAGGRQPGRFQLEAAIQSAHIDMIRTGTDHHVAIVEMYRALSRVAPSVGATVGHAAALLTRGDADAALGLLEAVAADATTYQPWWATKAAVHEKQGDLNSARTAYDKAIGLTRDAAVAAYLMRQHPSP